MIIQPNPISASFFLLPPFLFRGRGNFIPSCSLRMEQERDRNGRFALPTGLALGPSDADGLCQSESSLEMMRWGFLRGRVGVTPAPCVVEPFLREGQTCILLLPLAHPQNTLFACLSSPGAPALPVTDTVPPVKVMGTTENPAALHQATDPSDLLAKPPTFRISVRNRHQSLCPQDPCPPTVPTHTPRSSKTPSS